jgi:hypothetical protein
MNRGEKYEAQRLRREFNFLGRLGGKAVSVLRKYFISVALKYGRIKATDIRRNLFACPLKLNEP